LPSKYTWLAIAIIVLIPIGVLLSAGREDLPDSPSTRAPTSTDESKIAPPNEESARTAIYFPLFAHPGPLWENMLIYREAHPDLPWIAIVDPHHGPGEQYDENYARNIERLQAANVTVLGYVSTLWAAKSSDLVKEDIRKYNDWYKVDGILLDEMISEPGREGLYYNFTKYAKSLGMSPVIGNVGTNISPTYAGTVDSISTVEGDRTPPLSWLKGWQLNFDKSNFLYITYSQSWIDPEYIAESTNYVDSLYITDDTMPFPYDDFPAYLDEVIAVLDPHSNNDLRTLSVRASDLRGNGLEGTLATISSDVNGTTLQTPLARVDNVNTTYTVSAVSNSTHVFDHWDDGTTNPSRTVTLDASKILRAYYKTSSTSDLQSSIVVNALTTQGGELGMWINIFREEADSISGLTPLVAQVQDGLAYTVSADDHQHLVFDHWEDGSTSRTRTVNLQGNDNAYLTAYYRLEKNPSLVDLTIDAYTLDGTEIRGLWSVITPQTEGGAPIGDFTPMTHVATSGLTYTVEAQDHGTYTFSHWEDGDSNRTRTVTPTSDTTVSAYYRTPPATLGVNFVSSSGEDLIGMSVTVMPLGNSTSAQHMTNSNMTYAGRLASVYTITASDNTDYAFDHWDNGSTNKVRNVILSSNNTEVIAYYSERRPATSPLPSSPSPSHSQVAERADETTGTFVSSTFAEGLMIPSAMEFAPDGRLFIAELGGNVRIVQKDGMLLDTPFLSVSTNTCCESGLLGITLDPNFATNGYVYVYYTVDADPMHNRVSRFPADPANPDIALTGSEQPILDLDPLAPNFHHGGAIHFGKDGQLYVGVGDNYIFGNAQMLTTSLGKILRINSDGSIPTDNPFYNTTGARKEIWALGLRNPFTFAFSPADGRMFINDVGHDWAEEINVGVAGANYGWPICEGACLNPDFVDPVYAYTQEDGLRKAIAGGAFYEGNQFPAEYKGSYFFGDYVQGFIKRLTPDGQVMDFVNATSPVDIDVGPDGSIYYLSIATGEVRKVQHVLSE
jgi:glucose/arabinose dehydrogenase